MHVLGPRGSFYPISGSLCTLYVFSCELQVFLHEL
jgi:hypothetical protein